MSLIDIDNMSFTYVDKNQEYEALKDMNLHIEEGEFLVVVGPSGCGKSTFLNILAGLRFPSSGTVKIHGRPITGTGTDRGVVFQHYSLFPWMTAVQNVVFGILQADKKVSKKEADKKAMEFLDKVELADAAGKYPYQLSGGMQQRVAIARTLAMDGEILLMDEPFGAVDPKNRMALQGLLEYLWKSQSKKKTIVFITHDIDEALLLADRIIFMGSKGIQKEISINFPRPRGVDTVLQGESYCCIRRQLVELFYENAPEEVVG